MPSAQPTPRPQVNTSIARPDVAGGYDLDLTIVDAGEPPAAPPAEQLMAGLCLERWTVPPGQTQMQLQGVWVGQQPGNRNFHLPDGQPTVLRWTGWLRVQADCVMPLSAFGGPKLKIYLNRKPLFDLAQNSDQADCRRTVKLSAGLHEFRMELSGTGGLAHAFVMAHGKSSWSPLGHQNLACRPIDSAEGELVAPAATTQLQRGLRLSRYGTREFIHLDSVERWDDNTLYYQKTLPTSDFVVTRSARADGFLNIAQAGRYRVDVVGDCTFDVQIGAKPVDLKPLEAGEVPAGSPFISKLPWQSAVVDLPAGLHRFNCSVSKIRSRNSELAAEFRVVPERDLSADGRDLLVCPATPVQYLYLDVSMAKYRARVPVSPVDGQLFSQPAVEPDMPTELPSLERGLMVEVFSGEKFATREMICASRNPMSTLVGMKRQLVERFGQQKLSLRARGWVHVAEGGGYLLDFDYDRKTEATMWVGNAVAFRIENGRFARQKLQLSAGYHQVLIEVTGIDPKEMSAGMDVGHSHRLSTANLYHGKPPAAQATPVEQPTVAPPPEAPVASMRPAALTPPAGAKAGLMTEQYRDADLRELAVSGLSPDARMDLFALMAPRGPDVLPFSFRFRGFLRIDAEERALQLRFWLDANVVIQVNGSTVAYTTAGGSVPIRLSRGYHAITIEGTQLRRTKTYRTNLEISNVEGTSWTAVPGNLLWYWEPEAAVAAGAATAQPATAPAGTSPSAAATTATPTTVAGPRSQTSLRAIAPETWPQPAPRPTAARPDGAYPPGASAVGIARSAIRAETPAPQMSTRLASRLQLADKLFENARKEAPSARQMALLCETADVAGSCSKGELVLKAMALATTTYPGDPAAALAMVASVAGAHADKLAVMYPRILSLTEDVLQRAEAGSQFESAGAAANAIAIILRKDPAATALRVRQQGYRVLQMESERMAAAIQQAAANPGAGAASPDIARYHFLVRQDWEAGIAAMLASGDPDLKALAEMESKAALTEAEMVRLGSAWIARSKLDREPYASRGLSRGRDLLWRVLSRGTTPAAIDQAFDALREARPPVDLLLGLDLTSAGRGFKVVRQAAYISVESAAVIMPAPPTGGPYELTVEFTMMDDGVVGVTFPGPKAPVKIELTLDNRRFETDLRDQTWVKDGPFPVLRKRQSLTLRVKDGVVDALLNGTPIGSTLVDPPVKGLSVPTAVTFETVRGPVLLQSAQMRLIAP